MLSSETARHLSSCGAAAPSRVLDRPSAAEEATSSLCSGASRRPRLDQRSSSDTRGAASRGLALARLILDTTVIVDAERRGGVLDDLIGDEDDVAMAAVTA